MESDNDPPPHKPRKPMECIPVGCLGILLAIWGFVFRRSVLGLSANACIWIGLLLAAICGYRFLRYGADFDYYDWYHGLGNPKNRK
jgi:hypothetical protein